ncbi:MAG: TauD/TfdA family dioxygenase [Polyangiales bacterium]
MLAVIPERPLDELKARVERGLREDGWATVHVGAYDAYGRLAEALGEVVGAERIALRPGAHAYVAQPGPVPLHTDQPEVAAIGWWCEAQDDEDGASLLLDTWPVVDSLPDRARARLRCVDLVTPPLAGGPPTMRWPVLRPSPRGEHVFCSPWLRAAGDHPEDQAALDDFRRRVSEHARTDVRSVRLRVGEALFVDNRRVLHGRRAIGAASRRCLRRLWLRCAP